LKNIGSVRELIKILEAALNYSCVWACVSLSLTPNAMHAQREQNHSALFGNMTQNPLSAKNLNLELVWLEII
jgi:hypothetical protein